MRSHTSLLHGILPRPFWCKDCTPPFCCALASACDMPLACEPFCEAAATVLVSAGAAAFGLGTGGGVGAVATSAIPVESAMRFPPFSLSTLRNCDFASTGYGDNGQKTSI